MCKADFAPPSTLPATCFGLATKPHLGVPCLADPQLTSFWCPFKPAPKRSCKPTQKGVARKTRHPHGCGSEAWCPFCWPLGNKDQNPGLQLLKSENRPMSSGEIDSLEIQARINRTQPNPGGNKTYPGGNKKKYPSKPTQPN